jgi:hypothetical protein
LIDNGPKTGPHTQPLQAKARGIMHKPNGKKK